MKWIPDLRVLSICSIVVACGGGGGGDSISGNPPPVAAVNVTVPATIFEGESKQAQASAVGANGAVLSGRSITWSSSNQLVATVSTSGSILGVAAGTATITASSEGKDGSSSVTVTRDPAPTSIAVTPATLTIPSGGSSALTVEVKNSRGQVITSPAITYTSSAPSVATVSNAGVVSAVGPVGSANIVASIGSVSSTPIAVSVSPGAIATLAKQADVPASPTVASSSAISVKATDSFGNPIPGASVSFAVTAGGGTVTPTATTDANGIASSTFQLGTAVGVNTAVATSAAVTSSPFTTTTVAAAPSAATIKPGSNNQSAPTGTSVPISVVVTDTYGNPVVSAVVVFSTESGGLGSANLVPTDANGVATYQWRLVLGTNKLFAKIGSTPELAFTATGT